MTQQSSVPPSINTIFAESPVTLMYAEFFVPSDIAARKEWPLHESMRALNEQWREKSLADAESADAIIVPTHYAKTKWPNKVQDKVHVVFDGIDTVHLARDRIDRLSQYGRSIRKSHPGKKLVGYVGRTTESVRGFDSWMKAYVKLRRRRDDIHFVVFGQDKTIQRGCGSEHYYGIRSFRKWTLDLLGLVEDELTDITWIPYLDLYHYLSVVKELNLVIYPMYGMFGNWSLFQSLQMGAPMVASSRAYLPEVFCHGENGFLVDPDDIDGIVRHALAVLESPELEQKFRQNAIATIAERFSADVAAKDLLGVLAKLGLKTEPISLD